MGLGKSNSTDKGEFRGITAPASPARRCFQKNLHLLLDTPVAISYTEKAFQVRQGGFLR
jgi:hypothetical protein